MMRQFRSGGFFFVEWLIVLSIMSFFVPVLLYFFMQFNQHIQVKIQEISFRSETRYLTQFIRQDIKMADSFLLESPDSFRIEVGPDTIRYVLDRGDLKRILKRIRSGRPVQSTTKLTSWKVDTFGVVALSQTLIQITLNGKQKQKTVKVFLPNVK